ncbi:hypothetical protein [Stenotrophomonas maltophilia]|uniref:hypothetical protein n=1 Tax=Stenotrophomonas maltophilia TaxID=40324 RepID=UPI0018DF3B11|nr:hypothetical protein [Stenotrophomonas maltophilia]
MAIYRVGSIEWEADGEHLNLPHECTVECEDEGRIADALSSRYGWLVANFLILERSY